MIWIAGAVVAFVYYGAWALCRVAAEADRDVR